ncbi:MAG: glycosyltransferase family 4 protein [Xanthobacteraceae bacterium]
MSRLIFVNRFFFPDHSATSQIVSDLAFHLAGRGRDVHAVTSRQSYENAQAALPDRDSINGVQVHRVASTQFGRSSLPGRSLDYLSFYRSVRRKLAELARRGDVVIVKTDPPLLSVAVMGPVRRNGARLINWLQDIYPETAVALGVPFIRGPVGWGLAPLRNRSLRDAEATVVLGELMAQRVAHSGAPAARIHVIANWCNDEDIRPLAAEDNPLRREWNLGGKFVVGYSGNLGRAHEFGTVLAAAERLRNDARFVFLMIGGGRQFEELGAAVEDRRLGGSFLFKPYQDRSQLRYSLSLPDAHWLSLNPKLEGLLLPSKFYGIAAAGKPMIFIGDTDGELARLMRHHGCGIAIAPGDAAMLADTLLQWSNAPAAPAEMGAKARAMLEAHYSRERELAHWRALLDEIAQARTPAA